jgi:hypothetical protein
MRTVWRGITSRRRRSSGSCPTSERRLAQLAGIAVLTALAACSRQSAPPPGPNAAPRHAELTREEFNRRAAAHFLPLFWREDSDHDGALEPRELAVLWGYPESDVNRWIDQHGNFTRRFEEAYESLTQPEREPADPEERARHVAVLAELAQGEPTLVESDLRSDSASDRAMVHHLMRAAEVIEQLFARQNGVLQLEAKIPADDVASRALFHRNQSPYCEAPKTQSDPACSALVPRPARIVGLYPAEVQQQTGFCEQLARRPDAAALMDHFSVVSDGTTPGTLVSTPYSSAYREDMDAVASTLELAAKDLGSEEPTLVAYLRAAAGAFRTNVWESADRAWVAMGGGGSNWYVRVAPDETYDDPCQWKAGFQLQLARINPQSREWQQRLLPLKQAMEEAVAALAGPPYATRKVAFKLPDFIDVMLNAGDARAPSGATVGESLPNWGPIAKSGGRTVVMTNFYRDPDSRARLSAQESSIFCTASKARAGDTRDSMLDSLLHETAHNLGPTPDYRVNGKTDDEVFGGTLASTLEELKAQNSSLFLASWLQARGVFSADDVAHIHYEGLSWAFGHISRGMYASDGTPRNYSQLAAIQIGSFLESGALTWHEASPAANGTDKGCLEVDFARLPAAVDALERTILEMKSRGDKAGAERLKSRFVDAQGDFAALKAIIADRWLRAPKATFVYSLVF